MFRTHFDIVATTFLSSADRKLEERMSSAAVHVQHPFIDCEFVVIALTGLDQSMICRESWNAYGLDRHSQAINDWRL